MISPIDTSLSEKVLEYYFDNRKYYLDLLQRLVLQESPSNKPKTVKEVLDIIGKEFDGLDYNLKYVKGKSTGGYLLAELPKESTLKQMLVGHADTVWPVGTLKKMPVETESDIMRGPGIFDMKAGVTSMVLTAKMIHDLKLSPKIRPVFMVTSDEEIGSPESRTMIETLASESTRAFVLEPALGPDGKIKTTRKGVGHFEIAVKGKAAHAGLAPEEGSSAILALSHVIQELFSLNNPEKGISVNVGTIDGGLRSNVIAPESTAAVDVRVMTWADAQFIEEKIYNLKPKVDGVTIEVTGCVDRMPMEATERNQNLWEKARLLGESIDLKLEGGLSGGASDGNFTSQFTATLDGLGAVGDGAHALHEHIKVDESLKRAALLSLLVLSS